MKPRLILGLALIVSACGHVDPQARFAEAQRAFAAEDYVAARRSVLAALDPWTGWVMLGATAISLIGIALAVGFGGGTARLVCQFDHLGQPLDHGRGNGKRPHVAAALA